MKIKIKLLISLKHIWQKPYKMESLLAYILYTLYIPFNKQVMSNEWQS